MQKQYTFLIFTDIHHQVEYLKKVPKERIESADFVLCLGDTGNIMPDEHNDKEKVEETRKYIEVMKDFFKEKTFYYIPGNHDRLVDYDSEKSGSCHNSIVDINDKLFLAGFGGSVPAFFRDGRRAFGGFPFETDEDLGIAIESLRNRVEEKLKGNSEDNCKQVILLTHVGPKESQTSEYREKAKDIPFDSGSDYLSKWILSDIMQTSCICNLHGHTHPSPGEINIANVAVINPGPFVNGRYGYMIIEYNENQNKYDISSMQMHKLLL